MQNISPGQLALCLIVVLMMAGCAASPPPTSDDPLQNFIGRFDQILEDLDTEERVQHIPKLGEFVDDFSLQKTIIEKKIPFDSGEYELSNEGKRRLQSLVEEVITIKDEFLREYPDKSVIITITVIGYTDQSGFIEGTTLVKDLLEGVEGEIPKDRIKLRRLLNQRLSEKRAGIVSGYVKQLILAAEQEASRIQIEQDVVGQGEEIPPDVLRSYPSSYTIKDPQRQICYISVKFLSMDSNAVVNK